MNDTDNLPEKDPTIIALLEGLCGRLGPDAFEVVDHWEYDLCAVGIASPRDHGVLAYLSTFNLPPGRYDVELELPSEPGQRHPYREAGKHHGVDFEGVAELVGRHLSQRSNPPRSIV